jgi:hypothetical protein
MAGKAVPCVTAAHAPPCRILDIFGLGLADAQRQIKLLSVKEETDTALVVASTTVINIGLAGLPLPERPFNRLRQGRNGIRDRVNAPTAASDNAVTVAAYSGGENRMRAQDGALRNGLESLPHGGQLLGCNLGRMAACARPIPNVADPGRSLGGRPIESWEICGDCVLGGEPER